MRARQLTAALAVALSPLLACQACTPTTQGKGVQTVQPAVDLIACVLPRVVACATAKPPTPWTQCTLSTAEACGTDAATIVSIWAEHKRAMALESDPGVSYP